MRRREFIAGIGGAVAWPLAARAPQVRRVILSVNMEGEIDAAFASLDQHRPDALLVPTNPVFLTKARQIAALLARYHVPAIYGRRDYAAAGDS